MANIFHPEPINAGDLGIWGTKELNQNRIAYGILTCQLYDDSGTLKLTKGKVGIDDNTVLGVADIDTVTTISLAGVSVSNWFKVEMSVSGTTVTFAASDIAGETDAADIPAGFTGAYDSEKGGYYITATKRTVGIGYLSGVGVLRGVFNCDSVIQGYHGSTYLTPGSAVQANVNLNSQEFTYLFYGRKVFALPTVIGNYGMKITVHLSSNDYVQLDPDGAEKINGRSTVELWSEDNFITIVAAASEWKVIDYNISINSGDEGMINCSDWPARHLGWSTLDYDNLSGTFLVGEWVTESVSGKTGKIVYLTGSQMQLVDITNGGVWSNNRVITGSTSGATCDVNEPAGSSKNQDADLYHGTNNAMWFLDIKFLISSDGTGANTVEPQDVEVDRLIGVAEQTGWTFHQVDANNQQIQTGQEGLRYILAGSTTILMDTEDFFYKPIIRILF